MNNFMVITKKMHSDAQNNDKQTLIYLSVSGIYYLLQWLSLWMPRDNDTLASS